MLVMARMVIRVYLLEVCGKAPTGVQPGRGQGDFLETESLFEYLIKNLVNSAYPFNFRLQ